MHLLKRLELNGFKSFAAKTVLDFPKGITAIVGPNGSGKSNVVDAIRWLLGERDAKHLRGGTVEDLIFSGTPERPRSGLAQAGLHFENTGNFFPVDAAEVVIQREVSRDGISKYFLNKSEILLRDLVDFFARARLGSRGLVVVTQGNSDLFIRAEPKVRREMIEEILGLREYQLKRTDAERRLAQSEENMHKAEALIGEILPHLRSLRRQANRWEKRGTLEEELKQLEDRYFGGEWNELQHGLEKVEKEMKEHQSRSEVLTRELKAAEEKQRAIEKSQPEERIELVALRKEIQGIAAKKSECERELAKLEAHVELLGKGEEDEDLPPAAEVMKVVGRVREMLLAAEDADVEALQTTVQSALEEIEALFAHAGGKKERAGDSSGVREKLEKVAAELGTFEKSLAGLRAKEQELEKNQEDFYKSFTAAVREVERVREALQKWSGGNQKFLLEKERFTLRREELIRQIEQAGRRTEEFSAEGGEKHEHKDENESINRNEAERRMLRMRGELAAIGDIDQAVMKEAKETETRYEFLTREAEDLKKAAADLKRLIRELSEKIRTEFTAALHTINEEFNKFFGLMFDGGHAKLRIKKHEVKIKEQAGEEGKNENNPSTGSEPHGNENEGTHPGEFIEEDQEEGIEIEFKLPRKRTNSLDVLSGGERSLVGIAALFALISVSPPPFLVLDEIDAALDERNARRFADLLKEFAKKTQFIVVTHNRATMEAADVLYGVTLGADGTSKVLSINLQSAK
ncbi:MAG: AAA family ATPase [Candidatus Liptonbacteria bacterium]|nr:AAA family ATPase [Candidatus Liptonbacteria bacterium]